MHGDAKILNQAKVYILVGLSGSGKSTLAEKLVAKHPEKIRQSVSATTRDPRKAKGVLEKDGVDYHFLTLEKFKRMLHEKQFLETADMVEGKDCYGTPAAEVLPYIDESEKNQNRKNVVMVLEEKGVEQIKAKLGDRAVAILLSATPGDKLTEQDLDISEQSATKRGDKPEDREKRKAWDRERIQKLNAMNFDHVLHVPQGGLEQALEHLEKIIGL